MCVCVCVCVCMCVCVCVCVCVASKFSWIILLTYLTDTGILGTLVFLAIVLILIFLGKQICVSIAIIKESSR